MAHASAEQNTPGPGQAETGAGRDESFWRSHTQISLQPMAPPSILGLYGYAAATFMVAANLAGWYGNAATPLVLFPFAMIFGGLAQFLAGMWSFRARDGLATAMHGTWGSFWLAYGLYFLLVTFATLPPPTAGAGVQVALGYWFIVLGAITWVGAAAAMAENLALALVLITLAAGATLLAIGWTAGAGVLIPIAGNVLVASAVIGFYTASAMLLQGSVGRVVLPMGARGRADRPGAIPRQPIQYEMGEPGVKVGQ
jgi:succinate-acetate transporter protein